MHSLFQDRLSLKDIAREQHVDLHTVRRWVLRGVRGQRLAAIRVGGRIYVLRAALDAFIRPVESGNRAAPLAAWPLIPADQTPEHLAALERLRAQGL